MPVQREEVRVEREPITDANVGDAKDGPAISEDEHEVTLHEEEVVTEKRAAPKERVRMDKQTVTDEETVSEQVRKEQIEAKGDTKKAPAGAASRSGGGRGQSSGRAVAPARQAGASKARRSRGIPRGAVTIASKVCAPHL